MASELPEELAQQIEDKSDGRTGEFRSGARWGARAALDWSSRAMEELVVSIHRRADERDALAQKVVELTLEVKDLRSAIEMLDGKPSYPWRDPGDRGRELLAAQKEDSKESKHHG